MACHFLFKYILLIYKAFHFEFLTLVPSNLPFIPFCNTLT